MLNALLQSLTSRLNSFWISVVRTATPIIAGHVAGWLLMRGVPIDDSGKLALTELIFAIFSLGWYMIGRAIETLGRNYHLPALETFGGMWNGLPAPPVYTAAKDAPQARAPPTLE